MVSLRSSWGDSDVCNNENVWGQDRRCSINRVLCDVCCSWQAACGASETNEGCLLIFLRGGILRDSAWALLILSSLAMRMNARHYAWSAMTTTSALRKCWQILKSHILTELAALHYSTPKTSPFPSSPPFSAFSLFIWEYDLSWWLREEIEKNVYFRKKMSLTCLNVFF